MGGAVFWHGTAGNDAYQPPADPPRQALSSCPARCSVFFFSSWLSRSKFRLHISAFGNTEPERRQRTAWLVTTVAMLVCYSRHDPPAVILPRQNRPQHAPGITVFFGLGQASCCPPSRVHHTPRMPNPHFARFSPGPFGTSSFMDLMGNPPQGEDIPPLEICEQLTTKAAECCENRRMLAQRVDFHRFSTPSSASTCSLCSIIHSSACCVLEMR